MGKNNLQINALREKFFILPRAIFSLGLCYGEISVYSYLKNCMDSKTYKCWPSYGTIGRAVKMSKNTVRKYIISLENKRLISTEYTKVTDRNGKMRNGNLMYQILPLNIAVDYHFEKQLKKSYEISRIKTKK